MEVYPFETTVDVESSELLLGLLQLSSCTLCVNSNLTLGGHYVLRILMSCLLSALFSQPYASISLQIHLIGNLLADLFS